MTDFNDLSASEKLARLVAKWGAVKESLINPTPEDLAKAKLKPTMTYACQCNHHRKDAP